VKENKLVKTDRCKLKIQLSLEGLGFVPLLIGEKGGSINPLILISTTGTAQKEHNAFLANP